MLVPVREHVIRQPFPGSSHPHVRSQRPYDPKQVAALAPETLQAAVEQARKEFEAATDLAALAAVKPAHLGDKAPLMIARREIGALPPNAKADAGKRVNEAQKQVREAFDERRVELEADRDERVLREEAVDVTLPWDRVPRGARHPLTTLSERIADVFVAMGWEIAEGPEVETEWFNFDALNFKKDHPARTHAGHVLRRAGRLRPGPAHPHLAGADPLAAGA